MQVSLDSRAAELLKLLVERYIQDGEPVGSRTLARMAGLGLSPATIRNVMADLDVMGFVASPHTSAGRVPTTRGYRYFVDSLLAPESLSQDEREQIIDDLVPGGRSVSDLVQATSTLLSRLTNMAAVVTVPRRNLAILRRIEFLPLSDNRVLAILVVNQHEVQNRVLTLERAYGADELTCYANLLNEHFAGRDLISLRNALARDAGEAQARINVMLSDAASIAERALEQSEPADYVMAGSPNLMAFEELADIKRLRHLFDALDRKRDLLGLFDQCLHAEGLQIFIGDESGYRVLDECSVITTPYRVNGEVAGVLGVIGPTRMAYSRIIPLVQETARALSAGLKDGT
ncbi:heat-inducible transcriptional repressor HrcA [Sinimarinibacterium sp. NLF-5-8]|uniref:heat-inducible transcriptional repressor HrcA n=1 Tax=Sinimarinibacterium sp. NLF-5-8 TaxID=2698684 RepID=UPI00137BAAFC|nr:heat-inducible transcriptional repressor HrcA [Sinimarinibacterium sp. NLF-5-8]QHS09426.1 heat-inducible transcription repressor HrcA [Sinimarinibacterium sp. NLF-5-8]